jgi:hypothetical protein
MSFSLNEKTLELNISAEFLEICRRYNSKAFMFGTTLQQEGSPGFRYDSRVLGQLPQFWRVAVLQTETTPYEMLCIARKKQP